MRYYNNYINNMIQTLNTSQVAHALLADEYANWSYEGANALAEMLEQYEEDTGEHIELDVVAIRCEYSEYPNVSECYDNYSEAENSNELSKEEMTEWLQERTQVIEFKGGIIVQEF